MKNKKIFKKLLLLILLSTLKINCYQTITLFLESYPTIKDKKIAIKKIKKLSRPSKTSKYILRSFTMPYITSGIYCSYGGNSVITDLNGQATFIRIHKKPSLEIIVTKNIVPILSLENTVHHWELSRKSNVKMYNMERKLDASAKAYFWDVTEKPLPKDNIVPKDSIVIFANPKYVYVPIGITMTTKNPQLVLPKIYIKPGINKVKSTLLLFNTKNLIASTKSLYKKSKKYYAKHLKN